MRVVLLGVLQKGLLTKYCHGAQEEEDLLCYKTQEQHCIFSSAICWYFTWEPLTHVQTSFILAFGRVHF